MNADTTRRTGPNEPAAPDAERENFFGSAPEPSDPTRRRVLVAATSIVGGVSVAAAAAPFILSMLPSERAKAAGAPVEADIGDLEPGTLRTLEWRGKPVWILRRTEAMVRALELADRQLSDPESAQPQQPEYCRNATRSINPEYLVTVALCTHLGCVPTFRPDVAPADLGAEWRDGFYCPCHGSKFDLAGRVYKGVPAPTNLEIPRHAYADGWRLIIGADTT